jgi:hypothetical protein
MLTGFNGSSISSFLEYEIYPEAACLADDVYLYYNR